MKTSWMDSIRVGRRGAALVLWGALLLGFVPRGAAAVPLPDHLLYGTIAVGGRPITRADTGYIVEARRTYAGPVIASYRMGSRASMGPFYYSLRIPVAGAAEATPTQAVLGESLVITVRHGNAIAHQVVHLVTEPGTALRLDFGAGVDTDGDGVPDGWELATFGTTTQAMDEDTDGDGASDRSEYVAGTNPRSTGDVFRLAIQKDGESMHVSFRALRSAGAGMEGRIRYYSLEVAEDPVRGPWMAVPELSRVTGNDQLLVHTETPGTNAPPFFRARVWVE